MSESEFGCAYNDEVGGAAAMTSRCVDAASPTAKAADEAEDEAEDQAEDEAADEAADEAEADDIEQS
jgi:hypothetical protein